MRIGTILLAVIFILVEYTCHAQFADYTDHYLENNGVKLHYVTKGEGPVLLFLHGFPDFWFTWKYQMDRLARDYQVVGMDLRAYNYSQGPSQVDGYKMTTLMSDVLTVIKDTGNNPVVLIANDWGGAIAWQVATHHPELVSRLIACNIPHPRSLRNYLQQNPETADYTKKIQAPNAAGYWSLNQLMVTSGAKDSELSFAYREAFLRSYLQGMLHYYKASYPSGSKLTSPPALQDPTTIKRIKCPVLMIHGLDDNAFPPGTINDHWRWIENSFSLITLPEVGHFVQREAPETVHNLIKAWLDIPFERNN